MSFLNCHFRAREGTEIFEEGRKPDVIHYVSSPNTENKVRNYYKTKASMSDVTLNIYIHTEGRTKVS